jgi:membrane protease YdiL (CAAX protease family)
MADLPKPTSEDISSASAPVAARPITAAQPTPWGQPNKLSRRDAFGDVAFVVSILMLFAMLTELTDFPALLENHLPLGGKYIWVLANGLVALMGVALVLRLRRQGVASIGLGRASVGRVLIWAAIAVPICYVSGGIVNLLVTFLRGLSIVEFAQERTDFLGTVSDISIRQILPITLFIGLYEEILFRGFLLSRMAVLCRSLPVAIFLTSVLFGSLHFTQGLTGMFQTGVVGLVLAIVVTRARSLWPSILAHACVDALTLIVVVLILPELREIIEQAATSHPTSSASG